MNSIPLIYFRQNGSPCSFKKTVSLPQVMTNWEQNAERRCVEKQTSNSYNFFTLVDDS
jgi:hypothetical protein